MRSQYSDVIVHLPGSVAPRLRAEVEHAVAARAGVGRVSVSPKTDRMILVDYDPTAVNARSILSTVRSLGIHAKLVGM